jgi:hypothetical protein
MVAEGMETLEEFGEMLGLIVSLCTDSTREAFIQITHNLILEGMII